MTTEKDPALTFGGSTDPRWSEPGSAEWEAAIADRIEELRATIEREGDWLVPGWTLGPGEADVMASALLDRLSGAQTDADPIAALIGGATKESGQ